MKDFLMDWIINPLLDFVKNTFGFDTADLKKTVDDWANTKDGQSALDTVVSNFVPDALKPIFGLSAAPAQSAQNNNGNNNNNDGQKPAETAAPAATSAAPAQKPVQQAAQNNTQVNPYPPQAAPGGLSGNFSAQAGGRGAGPGPRGMQIAASPPRT